MRSSILRKILNDTQLKSINALKKIAFFEKKIAIDCSFAQFFFSKLNIQFLTLVLTSFIINHIRLTVFLKAFEIIFRI